MSDVFTDLENVAVDGLVRGRRTTTFLGSRGGRGLENLSSSKAVRARGFR
jgi:hypothetical protein